MNAEVAALAARLADRLPERDLEAMVAALLDPADGLAGGRRGAGSSAVRTAYDELALLIGRGVSPILLAGSLLGAGRATAAERSRQRIDVVWTGPPSDVRTSRLTSAVIVDLIGEARTELLLVSFATQAEPSVAGALSAASARGVAITMLVERQADNPAYRGVVDPFPSVSSNRLAWPLSRRPAGASMHAKVLVIDRVTALVGSANLTGHALAVNLECGVLIRGGDVPHRIHAHVTSLVERGDLVVVS